MPRFLSWLRDDGSTKDTLPVNRYEGFQSNGAVILRDRRGTQKAEIPEVNLKSETLGDDPLAIYKPTGAKHVDAKKAMGNFTGWTYMRPSTPLPPKSPTSNCGSIKSTAMTTRSRTTTHS
jgi:hypothetical protein